MIASVRIENLLRINKKAFKGRANFSALLLVRFQHLFDERSFQLVKFSSSTRNIFKLIVSPRREPRPVCRLRPAGVGLSLLTLLMALSMLSRVAHLAHQGERTEQDQMLSGLTPLSMLSTKLLARFSYVYIMKVISLDRSFVLNSCNSQYNQFYCLSYLQTSVYSSKEFVTLVYLYLYLVLLLEQPLH